jgi:hypothetical protein
MAVSTNNTTKYSLTNIHDVSDIVLPSILNISPVDQRQHRWPRSRYPPAHSHHHRDRPLLLPPQAHAPIHTKVRP